MCMRACEYACLFSCFSCSVCAKCFVIKMVVMEMLSRLVKDVRKRASKRTNERLYERTSISAFCINPNGIVKYDRWNCVKLKFIFDVWEWERKRETKKEMAAGLDKWMNGSEFLMQWLWERPNEREREAECGNFCVMNALPFLYGMHFRGKRIHYKWNVMPLCLCVHVPYVYM